MIERPDVQPGSASVAPDASLQMVDLEAGIFRALSHPVRLRIVRSLRGGERCVCEFEPLLGIRQPNISQHLAILRAANVVTSRRDGLRVMYRLVDPDVVRVIDLVTRLVRRQGAQWAAALREPHSAHNA